MLESPSTLGNIVLSSDVVKVEIPLLIDLIVLDQEFILIDKVSNKRVRSKESNNEGNTYY